VIVLHATPFWRSRRPPPPVRSRVPRAHAACHFGLAIALVERRCGKGVPQVQLAFAREWRFQWSQIAQNPAPTIHASEGVLLQFGRQVRVSNAVHQLDRAENCRKGQAHERGQNHAVQHLHLLIDSDRFVAVRFEDVGPRFDGQPARCVDGYPAAMVRRPRTVFDFLQARNDELGPRLLYADSLHVSISTSENGPVSANDGLPFSPQERAPERHSADREAEF